MKKALIALSLIALIAGGYSAGVLHEKQKRNEYLHGWPSESWQDVIPDKYTVISPPGGMWVFEIEEREGKLKWRQSLMPIPKKWSVPSNYVSPEDLKERWFRKRQQFDRRPRQPLDNPVIETSKKKKYDAIDEHGVLRDINEDGIVEFDYPLLIEYPEDPDGAPMLYTGWTHICCGCGLVHKIGLVIHWTGIQWKIHQRWDVDNARTSWERRKMFGGRDPWKVSPFPSIEEKFIPER